MFGLFKSKKLHKKNHFTRRKLGDDGQYCYYNQSLNQWMLWGQICDNTDFKSEDELKGSTLLVVDKFGTQCDLKRESSIIEFTEKVDSFLNSVDLLSEHVDLEFERNSRSSKDQTVAKAQENKRPYRRSYPTDSSSSSISTSLISNSSSSSYSSSSDCSSSSYSGGGDSGGCF